tara:strand:- start:425 stop:958 length:534 start_codon:yes stop_codon:yes gene_type:complete
MVNWNNELGKVGYYLNNTFPLNLSPATRLVLILTLESGFYGDQNSVLEAMSEVAKNTLPFTIKANGLGVFVQESPVIYIRWVNNKNLTQVRQALSKELIERSRDNPTDSILGYQVNVNWVPKSTLAFKDSSYDTLPKALRILKPLFFDSILEVKKMALYEYAEGKPENQLVSISLNK